MQLHDAASSGDIVNLKALLSTDPSGLYVRNDNWETPLYCASAAGQLEAVRILLAAGARINAKAKKRFTPLHVAARFGHVEIVEELVNAGASLERETIRDMTPFLVAVRYGQRSCMEILLQHNSCIHAKDMFHRTALHWAVKIDRSDLFEILISKGADISITDKFFKTPVMQAVKSNRPLLLRRLLELGADCTSENKLQQRPIHVAALKGHCLCLDVLLKSGTVLPDSYNDDSERRTPLMYAVSYGQLEAAKLLLDRGADPNRVDVYGQTPLCTVVTQRQRDFHARPNLWYTMALMLIRGNTDVNSTCNEPGLWNDEEPMKNAMEIAFLQGFEEVMKVLAKAGSQPISVGCLFHVETQDLPEFARKNLALLDWLKWFYQSPRPLKELSRTAVLRRISASYFVKHFEALNLPPGTKLYLTFHDIADPQGSNETAEDSDSDSNTEEEMEPSVFDSDLYGDGEVHDTDEESGSSRPSYQGLP